MQGLTQYVLAFLEVAEAEGRALRSSTVRMVSAIMMLLVAALLALGGLGLLVWALFLGFARGAGVDPSWAAFWTGMITLLASGVIAWIAKLMGK